MSSHIYVVDDERNIRRTLAMILEGEGFTVETCASDREFESALSNNQRPDAILLDVRLEDASGLDILRRLRDDARYERTPVLMISGHATVREAVKAIHDGATDFFEKPLDRNRVVIGLRNALRTNQLQREVEELRAMATDRYRMIGSSDVMRHVYAQLEKVAPTSGRVLITGESGTGKELVARAVHELSPRKKAPFVKVNCAAIPAELIESELFGYERGAFTGAQGTRRGMFEAADGGTLFLDEIGDMSLSAQAKVLRALQNGEITRVGGTQNIDVDVRVVAATNKDLEQEVARGDFREDLFFRLNVIPIKTPPLRDRREDIPELVDSFVRDFCRNNGFPRKEIDAEVMHRLQTSPWPGNVRELRNVVERIVILSGSHISVDDLPEVSSDDRLRESLGSKESKSDGIAIPLVVDGERRTLRQFRDNAERALLLQTVRECSWNISKAATLLGVERTNLHKKLRAHGLRRELDHQL